MSRRLIVLGTALMLFVVVLAAPVNAGKPLDVTFELTTYFAPSPTDTFTAHGSAVDAGLMCSKGTKVELVPEKWSGNSDVVNNGQVISEYTCTTDDEFYGDTFVIKAQMHIDLTAVPTGWVLSWVLKNGTGDFAGLHGNGSGTGTLMFNGGPEPIGATDVYVGHLH